MGSLVLIPLEARFFPNLNGASLHRAFHVDPPIVSEWLKYCWRDAKTLTHISIYSIWCRNESYSDPHCPNVDFLSVNIVNTMTINLLTFCEQHVSHDRRKGFISITLATPYDITRREEAATRFWSVVFHLKRTWHVIFFSVGLKIWMQYLWIWSFFKIDSTFFSVGKISVLIVYRQCLQTIYNCRVPFNFRTIVTNFRL